MIGDTVNVASRVEAACKELGVSLLITESVRLQLDRRYDVESLGEVEVRGKTAPMRLYTVHDSASLEAEAAEPEDSSRRLTGGST